MILGPGATVEYTVTYLEMRGRPAGPPPPMPVGPRVAIVAADDPPVPWFRYLYGEVGRDWEWTDWDDQPDAEVAAFVSDPAVRLHTMLLDGWPGGFFLLDAREAGTCDLAYFGLVREAVGRGLGRWLLGQAIATGWDGAGVERMTVNTCSLDHPAALGLYQRMGFEPVRRETARRVLTRPRASPD